MSQIKFGTDGWRAVIAKDFTFENLEVVSQAIADYLKKIHRKKKTKVVIGYDARFLSQEFAETVAKVLCGNGIKVVLADNKVPTPVVSFYAKYKKCDLGVMITASHNPHNFNGLKIKTPQGGAAGTEVTSKVEKLLFKRKVKIIPLQDAKKKSLLTVKDLSVDYVEFLKNYVDIRKVKKLKMHVLLDVMYGSGDTYIERVLKQSKIKLSYLHKEFNPSFGGVHPEPTEHNLQELINKMKTGNYDLGIALDGDGDRIACVLKGGRYVNAQVLLPLLAVHLVRNHNMNGAIVKTVVGSNLIDIVALDLNRMLFETPVGFKYISHLFQTEDIVIGGEEAGGIGVKDYIPERDGTMAALLLLEMAAFMNKKPKQIIKSFERKFGRWYYSRISVPVGKINKQSLEKIKVPKNILGKKVERVNRLDGIKIITKSHWLMFRASGTEPIVRVYAEAKSKKTADRLISQGRKMLNAL